MAKYIKLELAELALKAVCNTCHADDCRGCYINTNGVEELVSNTIGAVPTIEIVQCKDCQFQKKTWYKDSRRKDGGYYLYRCGLDSEDYSHVCMDYDFCSEGKG